MRRGQLGEMLFGPIGELQQYPALIAGIGHALHQFRCREPIDQSHGGVMLDA